MGRPSTNVANKPPYLVREVLKAYDADGLAVTGSGQTIAILIDTFPTDTDMQTFWKQNNLPADCHQFRYSSTSMVLMLPRLLMRIFLNYTNQMLDEKQNFFRWNR